MKKYKCEHCGNFYKSKHSLNSHINSIHNDKCKYECYICDNKFNSHKGILQHLRHTHDILSKEYYDICFKINTDGICPICSGETKFDFRHFIYFKYCSSKCVNNCPDVRKKIIESNIKRFGVSNNTQLDFYKKLNSDKWKNKTKNEILKINEKSKNTCVEKYGVDNPAKSLDIKQQMKNTCLEKYGTEYTLQNKKIREKIIQTNLKKYGVENVFQDSEIIEKIRNIMISRGYQVDEKDYEKFKNYYKRCVSLTQINMRKYKFKENWNGLDYYDNEYIKDNYNLYKSNNENYPNIDHKISIVYGFINNISMDDICSIDNLCITKRKHNASKRAKIEKEYKISLLKRHK